MMTHSFSTETEQDAPGSAPARDEARQAFADRVPAPPNAMIGRERELDLVRGLLAREDVRLVTLTGPGGVGKTRLALALAVDAGDTGTCGVAFVPLAPLHDATAIPAAIAARLDVQETGDRPLLVDVTDRLRDDRFLLVLDNFEHVLAGAPLVAALLLACPELQVMVSSRRRLGLLGEHEVPIAPLTVADPRQLTTVEALAEVPAIRLFVMRAQAATPSFALTEAIGPVVAEICQRLDGLPLAIELAAPRTRLLSPAALLARLTHRLDLLTDGPRDAPERLQTMRQTIAWSYDLLDPAAQTLLRRLAVYSDGFPLAAAEAFSTEECDAPRKRANEPGQTAESVLAGLTALVDESLLQITDQPDGERRFAMLETVREFALEQLEDSGEAPEAQRRHTAFYLALVERIDPWQALPQETVQRLQTEHDNLRVALSWSIARAPDTALQLASGLWRFWSQRGYWSEGRLWLEQSLAAAPDAQPAMRAAALIGAGRIAIAQGDFDHAGRCFEVSLALAKTAGDHHGAARSLQSLGVVASNQSDFDRAADLFTEALGRFRPLQDQAAISRCLTDLGLVAHRQGDTKSAISSYEEALSLASAMGDTALVELLLGNLGGAYVSAGDLARGEALYTEALDQSRILGDQFGIAVNLYNLADCVKDRGAIAVAWDHYRESLGITHELGDRHLSSRILDRLAHLLTIAGLPRSAGRLLGAAAALRQQIGDTLFPIEEESVAEAITITRAALGNEAFQAAWDVGGAMPSGRAVAEALAIELPPALNERRVALQAQLKLGLTTREVEVLHLVAAGQGDKEIATTLAISRNTASKHVAALRAKLHTASRTGAVAAARDAGVL